MSSKEMRIPKEKQLEAICQGIKEFYELLNSRKRNNENLLSNITITKNELVEYLKTNPEIIKRYLYTKGSPRYHEQFIIEYDGGKYRVYEMNRDEERDVKEYDDFAEAGADYLISNLGLPPGFIN
ncbi:MAG: hypothetical protein KGJ02_08030 [Verrucomicrobiota bacterium]|nr:hypothetical protein [Verrucomicrobiota bacterium]